MQNYGQMNGKCQWGDYSQQDSLGTDQCNNTIKHFENKWHHLAVIDYKGLLSVYINGIKSPLKNEDWGACVPVNENKGDIYIGKDFYGDIDDIIIFDKALTQTEVNQLFNLEACCM